jgi:hypothetical protein
LFFANYLPLVGEAMLFDNSGGEPVLLARKLSTGFQVINDTLYQQLKKQHDPRTTA